MLKGHALTHSHIYVKNANMWYEEALASSHIIMQDTTHPEYTYFLSEMATISISHPSYFLFSYEVQAVWIYTLLWMLPDFK